mgnify:CR=1 FL=1
MHKILHDLTGLSLIEKLIKTNLLLSDDCVDIHQMRVNGKHKKILLNYPQLSTEIDEYCADNKNVEFIEKIYRIINFITDIPLCKCGNKLPFRRTGGYKYASTCGKLCPYYIESSFAKRDVTMKERYGVTNPMKSLEIRNKAKQTLMDNYNVTVPLKSKILVKKVKKTLLKKYGENYNKHLAKLRKEKYLKNHNRVNSLQLKFTDDQYQKLNDKNYLKTLHHDEHMSCTEIAQNLNISKSALGKKMKKFGIEIKLYSNSKPKAEKELFDIVSKYDKNVITQDRTVIYPQELDIVSKENKLVIEYNGLYWHSENKGGKDKNYHLNKTIAAEQAGYRCIQILENEWLHKKHVVITKIEQLLEKHKISGMECEVIIPTELETIKFYNENCFDGYQSANVNIGLKYNNNIVAIMSFNSIYDNKYDILNYEFTPNVDIETAVEKILYHFVQFNSPSSITVTCDRRWNNGYHFIKCGFELDHISEPKHYYVDLKEKSTSRRLYKELLNDDKQCDKIWDCGKLHFIKNFNNLYS